MLTTTQLQTLKAYINVANGDSIEFTYDLTFPAGN